MFTCNFFEKPKYFTSVKHFLFGAEKSFILKWPKKESRQKNIEPLDLAKFEEKNLAKQNSFWI